MNTVNNVRSLKQYVIVLHCCVFYVEVRQRLKDIKSVKLRFYISSCKDSEIFNEAWFSK